MNLPQSPEAIGYPISDKLNDIIGAYSEMHRTERAFLTGLLRIHKPSKILELGVAAGAGSLVILNAIAERPEARLYSSDLYQRYYWDNKKPTGWLALEHEADNARWLRFFGRDVVYFLDEIGSGIDFLVLDTAHIHPVETLNFLCILPYLSENAVVVLHDIACHVTRAGYFTASYACRLLFDSVAADKTTPAEPYLQTPNIGAFQINADTRKYVYNIFSSLFLPWGKLYYTYWDALVPPEIIPVYAGLFERCYGGDYRRMFLEAAETQRAMYKAVPFMSYMLRMIRQLLAVCVKRVKKPKPKRL